jgi:hypothetical protein
MFKCQRILLLGGIGASMMACEAGSAQHIYSIGTKAVVSSDSPLCQGDVRAIDEAIDRTEAALDHRVDEPIEIHLYDRRPLPGCLDGAAGCFVDGEVHTLFQSLDHEVVHAVASHLGETSSFWSEGLAEALSGRTQQGEADVASSLDSTPVDLDYRTAGHFTRWLIEVHGIEGIRAIASGMAFLDAYGMGPDEAISEFEANAPWSYPSWNSCSMFPLPSTGLNAYNTEIRIECSAPNSTTFLSSGTGAIHTIDITTPGIYRMSLLGGTSVGLMMCQPGTLIEEPPSEVAGDIIREDSGAIVPTFFPSEQEHEIRLEPGRVLLRFTTKAGVTHELLRFELDYIGA